jgi:hypothetical protein
MNEEELWKRSTCLWELYKGNLEGELPLLGTLKDISSKALEMGVCFHRGPVLGNIGVRSFPRAFESRVKFLYIRRPFIEEFERRVKEGSGNGQLSQKGLALGNLEGVHLPGLLKDGGLRKRINLGSFLGRSNLCQEPSLGQSGTSIKLIWAPFWGNPVYVRSSVWGIWNFSY